jgi:hypothetical protein
LRVSPCPNASVFDASEKRGKEEIAGAKAKLLCDIQDAEGEFSSMTERGNSGELLKSQMPSSNPFPNPSFSAVKAGILEKSQVIEDRFQNIMQEINETVRIFKQKGK